MSITVEYSAQVRQAAGRPAEDIDIPGPCGVAELLRLLAQRRGEPLRSALLEPDGTPKPSNIICIGDEMVRLDSPRKLNDGDIVAIISPIAGG